MFFLNSVFNNFVDFMGNLCTFDGDDKRETIIVFVYDTECLKHEADDPIKAVLYFHPSWVSDTQKLALCGQLIGSSYFLKDCFFKPRLIALQNGKFIFKEFGRFILAVGTDRNISNYLLEHRADLLSSIVKFYHRDLQLVYEQFPLQSERKNLSEKLYHIFETYLPILQRSGNIFQNTPKLRMPKTASNIYLEAIQTLQCCQQTKGILGGAILYNNKVVASQLSDAITKQIIMTDPLHIKSTGEQLGSSEFHIPNGVVMLVVYVDALQYRKLQAEAQRAQNLQTTQLAQGPLSFQYNKRKMKRDKSLIFTHIPEENATHNIAEHQEEQNEEAIIDIEVAGPSRPKSLMATRPTHLALRLRNYSNMQLPESGIASITFDETDSYPEFIGHTSVCSTPMAENKVLPVGNIMSICANLEDENNSNKQIEHNETLQRINNLNSLKKDFEKFFHNLLANSNKMERRNSLNDIHDTLKKFSKKKFLKQILQSFKTDVNRNGNDHGDMSPDFIEKDDEEEDSSLSSDETDKTSSTITDPTNPVFNINGQPMSRSLFQEILEKYYKLWGEDNENTKQDEDIVQLIEEFKDFDNELKKLDESLKNSNSSNATNIKADRNLNLEDSDRQPNAKTPMDKKLLSLPLKSMSDASTSNERSAVITSRKQLGSVPLTPLMAKLSVLATNEERPAWDATPGANIEIQTPLNTIKRIGKNNSLKCDEAVDVLSDLLSNVGNKDGLKKAELYICGQQNMTLILIMEEGCSQQAQIVREMFDICVSKFPHMESHLSRTLNINVEGDKCDGSYSFMSIDSKWDTLERNGPWHPAEINTLECMHRDMLDHKEVTDLVLRSYDSVYFGYKSGRAEIFYKEPAREVSGIPPPSDAMANVSIRAKNRLERDHSYILF